MILPSLDQLARRGSAAAAAALLALSLPLAAAADPLRVCATIPDLGNLAEAIGGPEVAVTAYAKPTEDPHFVDARPSFIRTLNTADLLVLNGLDLEIGWLPVLIQGARNSHILPGSAGYLDASQAIAPTGAPLTTADRSMGDVHARGNPHYLLDPMNGLLVARLLRDRLSSLRPGKRALFESRYQSFERALGARMAGEVLAGKYDVEKLALLQDRGKLITFLTTQGQANLLGGWWARMRPFSGDAVVQDHPIWIYFARRFELRIVANLEPKPGIPPTTKHMSLVAEIIRDQKVRAVLTAAYYDPKYGDFLSSKTGVAVARMANQVGSQPGTSDYLAMIDYDVEQVAAALGNGKE